IETGTVQFFDGALSIGTYTLPPFVSFPSSSPPCSGGAVVSNGIIFPITLPGVSAGTHSYTAVYSGDAVYAPSTSAAITLTVPPRLAPIATSTSVNASANPVSGDVRLTYMVSACAPNSAP